MSERKMNVTELVYAWKAACPQRRIPNKSDERVKTLIVLLRIMKKRMEATRAHLSPEVKQFIINACVAPSLPDQEQLKRWKLAVAEDLMTAIEEVWPLEDVRELVNAELSSLFEQGE